ncbi:hypothetical protein TNCV_919641 [Trichonephila clavipes]|nr:hypothetical protein TNCV_919641 [Trichonephila clavipes]
MMSRSCGSNKTAQHVTQLGYVKSLVYADKPHTPDHLEDNIRRVIADIRPQMLEKIIENWSSRLDYIRASSGSPMPKESGVISSTLIQGDVYTRGKSLSKNGLEIEKRRTRHPRCPEQE